MIPESKKRALMVGLIIGLVLLAGFFLGARQYLINSCSDTTIEVISFEPIDGTKYYLAANDLLSDINTSLFSSEYEFRFISKEFIYYSKGDVINVSVCKINGQYLLGEIYG